MSIPYAQLRVRQVEGRRQPNSIIKSVSTIEEIVMHPEFIIDKNEVPKIFDELYDRLSRIRDAWNKDATSWESVLIAGRKLWGRFKYVGQMFEMVELDFKKKKRRRLGSTYNALYTNLLWFVEPSAHRSKIKPIATALPKNILSIDSYALVDTANPATVQSAHREVYDTFAELDTKLSEISCNWTMHKVSWSEVEHAGLMLFARLEYARTLMDKCSADLDRQQYSALRDKYMSCYVFITHYVNPGENLADLAPISSLPEDIFRCPRPLPKNKMN